MNTLPPDYEIRPTAPTGQRIVEVIVSASGAERNYITVDADGLFRVFEQYWNTFVDEPEQAFWDGGGPAHFTDTLDVARRHALLGFSDSLPDEAA
jgi:hypothetical protein